MQKDTVCLSNVLPVYFDLTYQLKEVQNVQSMAKILINSLRKRFEIFLNPSAPTFNPLPAAACRLDITVAAALLTSDNEELLVAAKSYIFDSVHSAGVQQAK